MGRSSTFKCDTCKKLYYLGHGSYSSWLDFVDSIEEFEEKAKELHQEYKSDHYNWHNADGKMKEVPDPRNWYTNKNVMKCLLEHKGHNFSWESEDWSKDEDYPEDYEDINLDESEG